MDKSSLTGTLELAQKQPIENGYEAIQPPERRDQNQPRKIGTMILETHHTTKALTTALKPEPNASRLYLASCDDNTRDTTTIWKA